MSSEATQLREEQIELVAECYEDPVYFCYTFLEHLFPTEIPWVHRGLLAILTGKTDFLLKYGEVDKIVKNFVYKDDQGTEVQIFSQDPTGRLWLHLAKHTEIMMPRGSGKTTIAGIAVPLWNILFHETEFTLYLSESGSHAKQQLENVKRELSTNELILSIFGDLKPKLSDDERWAGDLFETKSGVVMAARGRGAQVRGLLHRGRRPDCIIVDDIEDRESVQTEAQRKKALDWFMGDVKPALPKLKDGKVRMLCTMLHADAVAARLQGDPDWNVVCFGVLDKDNEPLWPAFMDKEEIEAEKKSYARVGLLHRFYMEYFNEARAPEDQCFRSEFFIIQPAPTTLLTATYCDPAIGRKRTSNATVIMTCGMAEKDGRIYLLDAWGKVGASESEKTDIFFEYQRRWKSDINGIESIAYQAALIHYMQEQMFRRAQYFEIQPVPNKTKKNLRIIGILQGRYSNGYIVHTRRYPELETQLLDFRADVEDQPDDWPDALAGCIALLDPYAAAAAGKDLSEDEYEPLEKELGGDWRWA